MANRWTAPKSGNRLNQGQPWRRGDNEDLTLQFQGSPLSVVISGGVLPPGLFFNGATRKVQGTFAALPKDQTTYPVVFRATFAEGETLRTYDRSFVWVVNPVDEEQHWQDTSPDIKDLGVINRASTVTIQLDIVNPDADRLVYKAMGVATGIPGAFAGLPLGLEIDSYGRVIGSPTVTGNQPGVYYFKIYARDPDDLIKNPREEGDPRTSQKTYRITIAPEIVLDARLSDTVRWETPSGSLGSTYETYASHFAVKAVPQFQVSGGQSLETQTIRYTLTGRSKPLPDGLLLDAQTGLIIGRCPYVTVNTSYEFIVEARVVFVNIQNGAIRQSAIASERTFSLTVRSIFGVDSVTSLQINVPGPAREKIAKWIWGNLVEIHSSDPKAPSELTVMGRANTFRPSDIFFGKKREYRILLASGLNYRQDGNFLSRLKDYHHTTDLRIGRLASARARSPEGVHIYDVIYLGMVDPLEGSGGFVAGQEETLNRYVPGQKPTAIPQWNLSAQDSHYFPASIRNMRADMISTSGRKDWVEQGQAAADRGYGLVGREGLPLWMMSEQELGKPQTIPGYVCAIELIHVKAGSGPAIVRILEQAGMNEDLQGTTVTVDRYLLLSDGYGSTSFDFDQDSGSITTFDGPDNTNTPTTQYTTFDKILRSESKYYKFPPGDK